MRRLNQDTRRSARKNIVIPGSCREPFGISTGRRTTIRLAQDVFRIGGSNRHVAWQGHQAQKVDAGLRHPGGVAPARRIRCAVRHSVRAWAPTCPPSMKHAKVHAEQGHHGRPTRYAPPSSGPPGTVAPLSMMRLRQCDCSLNGSTRLWTVFPTSRADERRSLRNDIACIGLTQEAQRIKSHLFKASHHSRANPLDAQ